MRGRRVAWLVAVASAWMGSWAAHSLGLLHAGGEAYEHLGEQGRAAHDAVGQVPLPVGVLAAVVLTGLAHRAWSRLHRRSPGPLPAGWLLAVPLLGWAVQEAAERLLEVESFPFVAAREPAFLNGVVVQVLFGVLAVLVARLLLARIRQLRRLGQPGGWWPQADPDLAGVAPAWRLVVWPQQVALARGYSERGPPSARC